jgi:hypothetical protein
LFGALIVFMRRIDTPLWLQILALIAAEIVWWRYRWIVGIRKPRDKTERRER